MKKTLTTTGVVAEFNGAYWGVQHGDAQYTCADFGPIENATIANPEYCQRPTDLTYKGSYDTEKLAKARLVTVTRTLIYEVPDSATHLNRGVE